MSSLGAKVFINCPFDKEYEPFLNALLFCVISFDCEPLVSTLRQNSGENRFEKIADLITSAQFSIHDLSRRHSSAENEDFRMNMPFELGFDMGLQKGLGADGSRPHRPMLILEGEKFALKRSLSDLAGQDFACHDNDPVVLIKVVQHFFRTELKTNLDGPSRIVAQYADCQAWIIEKKMDQEGHSEEDARDLPVAEWIDEARTWISAGRPSIYNPKQGFTGS